MGGHETYAPFYKTERDIDYMDKIEQAKPTKEYVEASMKYVEEKIAKTTADGSWKGVDVDEFLDEMRGREPDDDDLAKEINAIHERYPEISFAKLSRICVRIANWQKKQIIKDERNKSNIQH